jgi:hypothetical protein
MGALNLPSAADIERLTRRLRSVSLRLEGIEEGVDRLDRTLSPTGADRGDIAERLSAIEDQLTGLTDKLDRAAGTNAKATGTKAKTAGAKAKTTSRKATAAGAKSKAKPAKT